jgi:hypothetical protein
MSSTDKPEAYRNGWIAHSKGKKIDENPYDEDTQNWSNRQWDHGWCERYNCQHTAEQDEAIEELF